MYAAIKKNRYLSVRIFRIYSKSNGNNNDGHIHYAKASEDPISMHIILDLIAIPCFIHFKKLCETLFRQIGNHYERIKMHKIEKDAFNVAERITSK